MADPIRSHASPVFKMLEEKVGAGEVDRDDLRRLVQALKEWRVTVDSRLDQLQSAGLGLRERVNVLETRVDALEAKTRSLESA